ncbi:MAG: transketolase [candidate division WS1 bacterium]|nr:transketolase [candidate division WS1 bacterium]
MRVVLTEEEIAKARVAANTIRCLSMEGVEKAKSGHPGLPMGAADYAWMLWDRYLRFSPQDPSWPNRDRFVLSAGHGSMLLYSLLHLFGYELGMEELQSFRQWGSRTAGHPEYWRPPGVETTTGPLGQGVGNAVGLALGGKLLQARFNQPDLPLFDYRVFCLASDGDMMEGVASEACSLAGHLGLGNLVVLYDDNGITIEGSTELAFTEDVRGRLEAYGWETLDIDGHDCGEIAGALEHACCDRDRPLLISCRTHIAFGAPEAVDTAEAHGAPLGEEEIAATKAALNCPAEEFFVPEEVRERCAQRVAELQEEYQRWQKLAEEYECRHPELWAEWERMCAGELPEDLEGRLLAAIPTGSNATRKFSGAVIQAAAEAVPWLVGGSADLAPSNNTMIKTSSSVRPGDFSGRNLHFGVREHGMGAILNGLAESGFKAYGATFEVFADYMRPSIRLAALSELDPIYIFTHDSIFLGEDGPTHQPIEQHMALRAIPNLYVMRPADGPETAMAWAVALERTTGPTALLLTRQSLPEIDRERFAPAQGLRQGGYVLAAAEKPDLVLLATGSEVGLALGVYEELTQQGLQVQLCSMPCLELFEEQAEDYQRSVLRPDCSRRVSLEAGITQGWERYVGESGLRIGIDHFGASAPAKVLAEKFGFTIEAVVEKIRAWAPELR